jgi:hypothetical protein
MASFAPITAARADATPVDVPGVADSIAVLVDLAATQLAALRAAVREHGAGAADLGDWHVADVLLGLATAQADLIERAARAS